MVISLGLDFLMMGIKQYDSILVRTGKEGVPATEVRKKNAVRSC
jgi:hypothetical protein